MPMAKIIANALEGELDVVFVHKLGAPGQPELAIGSVDEAGHLYLSAQMSVPSGSRKRTSREKAAQLETLRKRRPCFTLHPSPN